MATFTPEQEAAFRARYEREQKEEAFRARYEREKKSRELSHPIPMRTPEQRMREEIAQQLGAPVSEVDLSRGIPQAQRAGMGLLTDDPTEQERFLTQRYPEVVPAGDIYGVRAGPGEPILVSNPPGLDFGDVSEFAGSAGPSIAAVPAAGAAAAAAGFTGPGALMAAGAAGAGTAEIVREGLQRQFGTQFETPGEYLTRAGVSAGMELLPGAGRAVRRAGRAIGGAGRRRLEPVIEDAMERDLPALIEELREAGDIDLPNLKNFQRTDSPVIGAISKQSIQMSGKAQARVAQQLEDLRRAVQAAAPSPEESSIDDIVQQSMERLYRRRQGELAPEIQASEAGRAAQRGVRTGLDIRKKRMKREYDMQDEMVRRFKPTYDISKAQRSARQREVAGLALPPEDLADFEKAGPGGYRTFVNVAEPLKKLRRINAVLARLDPVQNHGVVRDLRSQVGRLREMPLAAKLEGGVEPAQVSAVYADLSNALSDPQGVGQRAARLLARQNERAGASAREYYDSYDKNQISRTLLSQQKDTPTELFDAMAENPATIEESFRDILVEAGSDSDSLGLLRRNLESTIMRTDDPLVSLRRWQNKAGEAYRWLYPTRAARENAEVNARVLKEMNEGPLREAFDAASERTGFARKTLRDAAERKASPGIGPEENMRALVAQAGGEGTEAHTALRAAVFNEILEKSIERHPKSDVWSINPTSLAEAVREWESLGATRGVLTARDRKVLDATGKFARRSWRTGDSGTGLAVASQIGQLRQGDLAAVGSVYSANRMANLLTDERLPFETLLRFVPQNQGLGSKVLAGTMLTVRQGMLAPWATGEVQEHQQ